MSFFNSWITLHRCAWSVIVEIFVFFRRFASFLDIRTQLREQSVFATGLWFWSLILVVNACDCEQLEVHGGVRSQCCDNYSDFLTFKYEYEMMQ